MERYFHFTVLAQSTESDDKAWRYKHVEKTWSVCNNRVIVRPSCKYYRKIFDNTDIICGYLTYPHVDFYETGYRAAALCKLLSGKERTHRRCSIPMIVPASGYILKRSFYELAKSKNGTGRLLIDYSIFQMQPWLDNRAVR